MAICLVPDFPAVRIALVHLSELDKRLREEGVSFSEEASDHLREIAEAIKELESSRKTAREKLEVETIETSKIRQRTVNLQDDIRNEISASVTAARESNTTKLNQLQSELKAIVQDIESMEEKLQLLEKENTVRFREREVVKENHEEIVNQLNYQLSEKTSKQILLMEKQNDIQSLKDTILQVQMAQQGLEKDMIQKKRMFAESRHTLEKEIAEIILKIKEQRKINAKIRKELDIVTSDLQDKEETVTQCKNHISQLEKNIGRLNACQLKCTVLLNEEIKKTEELDEQKEFLERELIELAEAFVQKVQALQQQMVEIENKIKEEQKVKNVHLESIAELSDVFSIKRKEEDDAVAAKQSLFTRLKGSKQTHEEHIISVAKRKTEIKNMHKEISQLHDANIISKDLFKRNLGELEGQLANKKISRAACETERDKLCQSLKTLKEDHEQHVREVNTAIELTKKRYEELLEEEKKLKDHVLLNLVIEELTEAQANTEQEIKHTEINYQAEIQQLTRDKESVLQSHQETEQKLKVQESILEEAKTQFDIDHLRHQTLKNQITELETQKNNLESSIQKVTNETATLIEPKDELKRVLETLRAKHMEMLTVHATEISAVEKNIYESGVMLEKVNMENSRLHLCIEQMKQDIANAKKEKEKYIQEAEWMETAVKSLYESLLEAWASDMVLTKESGNRDQKIVVSLNRLEDKIQERKHRISDISKSLEEELVDMSSMLENPDYNRQEINTNTTR